MPVKTYCNRTNWRVARLVVVLDFFYKGAVQEGQIDQILHEETSEICCVRIKGVQRIRSVAEKLVQRLSRPRKQWRYKGHSYLSSEIESSRLEATALGLVPLQLQDQGIWDPEEHYWGEPRERTEEWAKPIIAKGPRPEFRIENVIPGADPDNPFSDLGSNHRGCRS